ncbi:MAG: EB domain-containing protein [Myxococcota bacterium]
MTVYAGFFLSCSNECLTTSDDSSTPSPAVECRSNELCYRGQCVPGCAPGLELFEACETDRQCDEPRGSCVEGFCSACTNGTSCVPGLDVCQPIAVIPRPDPPPRPDDGSRIPAGPLDASLPDGLVRFPDDEVPPPSDREVTRAVRFNFAQRRFFRSDGTLEFGEPRVQVDAWDVRGTGAGLTWKPEFVPARIQTIWVDDDGMELRDEQCELRRLTTPTVSISRTDLGTITFTDPSLDEGQRSILTEYEAVFRQGRYVSTPIGPPEIELFVPSIPGSPLQGSVLLSGTGRPGITAGGFSQLSHVPFDVVPTSSTAANLASGWRIRGDRELVVSWRNPIRTGVLSGEAVFLEISAPQGGVEIACEEPEGPNGSDEIVVRTPMLRTFVEQAGAGGFALRFGRKNERVVAIRPGPGELVAAVLRVSLEYAALVLSLPPPD